MTALEAKHLTFTSSINSDFYKRCIETIRKRCSEGCRNAYITCNGIKDFNMRDELKPYFISQGYEVNNASDSGLVLKW